MLVEMPVVVYKISEYDDIDNITLDNDVLSKIESLKEMYSKVQQNNDIGYNNKKKKNYKRYHEVDPNFKATVFQKREGIDKCYSGIKALVNKITEANYGSLEKQIFEKFDELVNHYDESDILSIQKILINDLTWNSMQSKINSLLLKTIINRYNFDICIDLLLKEYDDIITNISSKNVNCDTEYDEFCETNRINNLRRSMGLFMINMMRHDLIKKNYIINIIKYFQDMLFKSMSEEDKKILVDELTENLYVLIVNSKKDLNTDKEWDNIIEKIHETTKKVVKDYPSFTSRSKFKHMDIVDCLKK
jgi:hypothetical protein